jgi:hypothetical protein
MLYQGGSANTVGTRTSLGEASAGAWGRLHDSSSCDNDESNE